MSLRSATVVLGASLIAACSCGPPGGPDTYPWDTPPWDAPAPICIEQFVRDGPGPLRPGGLVDSINGIEGLGVAGPITVARMVEDELMVSVGLVTDGLRGTRHDAVIFYGVDGREDLVWARQAVLPQASSSAVMYLVAGTLGVDDRDTGSHLFTVPLVDRFPQGIFGACNPERANMMFVGGDENVVLLRYSRCEGATDEGSDSVWYRLHLWDRMGAEQTPPDGIAVEEWIYLLSIFPSADSLVSNDDGELFYGAQRAGLDAGSAEAVRVVRRNPDMTLSMVSEPITDPDIDLPGATGIRQGEGFWGAPTADGAYVAHVIAPIEPAGVGYSHFVRVERDGSIGWHYTTFARATRGSFDRRLTEYAGGIVALLSDASLPADLSLFAVTADGTLVHGPRGLPIADRVGFTPEVRDAWVAVDGDGAGGLFIALMGDESPIEGAATHLSADGSVIFGPAAPGFFRSGMETELFQVLADGEGGVWMVGSGSTVGLIQHVDALGRPLYHEHWASCRRDSLLRYRWEHSIIDYSEGDAGLEDAGTMSDAPAVVEPFDAGAIMDVPNPEDAAPLGD